MRSTKIVDFSELGLLRKKFEGKKLVQCHGVFDVLHAGHLAYFESAKKFGDLLVVTVTADEHVNKGPGRPYFNSVIRANMLAGLSIVDFVSINPNPTAVPAIEKLKPHFYVKGPDYRDKAKDLTGAIYKEEQAAEISGGRLVFTSDETYSSSSLINEYFQSWTDEQSATIAAVKNAGGLDVIEQILHKIANQRILIVGEPIVDSYAFCRPEAISSKSPSISAKFLFQEDYAGGSLAIANHLADFAKEVTLVISHGGEPYFTELLEAKLDKRIRLLSQEIPGVPTPRKTRFITEDKTQRMFEITDLRSDQWFNHTSDDICRLIMNENKKTDCALLSDFGHGFFEGPVLEQVSRMQGFVGLNVQTNSSNFGFNPFTKHKRFSYLSVDIKEARVAYHDRFASYLDLLRRMRKNLNESVAIGMTLGPAGAYYFSKANNAEYKIPAFTDVVIDTVGAGDAFFSLTSALVCVESPEILIPFLGNVFAGLKTKIIGNKSPVTQAQLIKAVSSILK